MTKNAEIILKIVNESGCHMTAEDIYQKMRSDYGKVVLATVYNNLNALSRNGLIRRIVLEGSPDRYDKTVRHDHLVCRTCGAVSDFFFDDLTKVLEARIGQTIDSYDLSIHYVCPTCKEKKA